MTDEELTVMPADHEPDFRKAMLYHSDRADALMQERDSIAAEVLTLRVRERELEDENKRLRDALAINAGAWDNALELDLLPDRHRKTAEDLRNKARALLSEVLK